MALKPIMKGSLYCVKERLVGLMRERQQQILTELLNCSMVVPDVSERRFVNASCQSTTLLFLG
jgi:hypothetical protein